MALHFKEIPGGAKLPAEFQAKTFRSYVAMADYADDHHLPEGKYFIFNDKGGNALTRYRELTRKGTGFHVEGRGNV